MTRRKLKATTVTLTAVLAATLAGGAVAPAWAATDVASIERAAGQSEPTVFPGSKTIPVARAGEPFEHRITYAGRTDAVTADGLPAGLSMDASGLITGRPAVKSGTYTFTLAAFDRILLMPYTGQASIHVEPAIPDGTSPALEGSPPETIAYGEPYSYRFTLVGPGPTVRLSSGTLPPGLSLTPDGLLSGQVTAGHASTYTFSVVAENDIESSAPREFSLTVPAMTNYLFEGASFDEFRYSFTSLQTIAWNTHQCPERTPYLVDRPLAPEGSIFPRGARMNQPGGDPLWYSATATERDGKQSGVKDLHMYNPTMYAFDVTLVLHCTNDRNAAADF